MIQKIDCVCVPTKNVAESTAFYTKLGLVQAWSIERELADGGVWTLAGLKFPDATGCELVLSDNPEINFTEIELRCDDVRGSFAELNGISGITWIREPFATESGHVAVMKAPDGNVFVLVGP